MNAINLVEQDIFQNEKDIINHNRKSKVIKRILDVIISLVGLILTLPIMLVACIAIVIDSNGSPVYQQERVGQYGRVFMVYKLRTMFKNSSEGNLSAPQKGDRRVTKVGSFLRKTSIDELPQLINVLKGDMSILGPRAVPEKELRLRIEAMMKNDASKKTVYERAMEIRSLVRPGISGMAQANGRSELSVEQATAYDIYYVLNYSLALDMRIIIQTAQTVILGKGVN